jgi:CrcB protein
MYPQGSSGHDGHSIMKPMPLLLVGLGGFFGAIARYALGLVLAKRLGTTWPYATFIINVTGCFALAFFMTLVTERTTIHEGWRYLFPIGFVGAYTTFSTYEYETARLIETGALGRALSYVMLSTIVGFAAVVLATWVVRRF